MLPHRRHSRRLSTRSEEALELRRALDHSAEGAVAHEAVEHPLLPRVDGGIGARRRSRRSSCSRRCLRAELANAYGMASRMGARRPRRPPWRKSSEGKANSAIRSDPRTATSLIDFARGGPRSARGARGIRFGLAQRAGRKVDVGAHEPRPGVFEARRYDRLAARRRFEGLRPTAANTASSSTASTISAGAHGSRSIRAAGTRQPKRRPPSCGSGARRSCRGSPASSRSPSSAPAAEIPVIRLSSTKPGRWPSRPTTCFAWASCRSASRGRVAGG